MVKSRVRSLGVLALGVVLLATTACGSDSTPGRADYRGRVNAECRDARAALSSTRPAPDAKPARLIAAGRRALARQREALTAIASIARPPRERRRIAEWLALVQRALGSVEASLGAQARVDLVAANRANAAGSALVDQADAAARRLGFRDCVSSGSRG
jgi:hypothetical protein